MQECELINSVYKASEMGCVGIHAVLGRADDGDFRQALQSQLAEYRKLQTQAEKLLDQRGGIRHNVPPMARACARMSAKMQLMRDHSASQIAGMMIQGNTKGMVKSMQNLRAYRGPDLQASTLARRLLETEVANIEQMKPYL